MNSNKKQSLTIEQFVFNAKKVLKGRLTTTNTAAFNAAIKRSR